MITGNRDTDIIVLTKLQNISIFKNFQNKYINKLYKNESLWRNRLFKYYAEIYPEPGQTWKDLYLNLVFHMKNYNKDQESLRHASANGYLSVVKYLISFPEIDPALYHNLPIRLASENGHLSVVKYLINLPKKYNIYPSEGDNCAIIRASERGHLSVVKYLIGLPKEYGINPSAKNNLAIRWATCNGRLDIVKYLIGLPEEYGINLSENDNEAIRWAKEKGHLELVAYLESL